MRRVFLDTETNGLVGPLRMIQYQIENQDIRLIPIPLGTDLVPIHAEIRRLLTPDTLVIGYNVGFDLFHLYKAFKHLDPTPFPCKAMDLMIHAKKKLSTFSPFAFSKKAEKTVARARRIHPSIAAEFSELVRESLQKDLPTGVFIKCHLHTKNAQVERPLTQEEQEDGYTFSEKEIYDSDYDVEESKDGLLNISWTTEFKFSLKNLMKCLGYQVRELKDVWPLPMGENKQDLRKQPCHTLNDVYIHRILNQKGHPFFEYAKDDIKFLKVLYDLVFPEGSDSNPDYNDSCTHAMAYMQAYGFSIDREAVERTVNFYGSIIDRASKLPFNLNSAPQRIEFFSKRYPGLSSTGISVLEVLAYTNNDPEALLLLEYGQANQRLTQITRALSSRDGRAHPSFSIYGTATDRMAGNMGLNYQGISGTRMSTEPEGSGFRSCIETCAGGDFTQLEVVLAGNIYNDQAMLKNLGNNLDMHLIALERYHPEFKGRFSYDELKTMRKDKTHELHKWVEEKRKGIKPVNFAIIYGGTGFTVASQLGVAPETGDEIVNGFYEYYTGMDEYKKRIESIVCTADTDTWTQDSVSRMVAQRTNHFGQVRYWEFEKSLAVKFWENASRNPFSKVLKYTRSREKGEQTYQGAVASAMLGTAVNIQKAIARQMANSDIQSAGAILTKLLMAEIWEKHRCPMINVHDEIQIARHDGYDHEAVSQTVKGFVDHWARTFKYLGMDFQKTNYWSDK